MALLASLGVAVSCQRTPEASSSANISGFLPEVEPTKLRPLVAFSNIFPEARRSQLMFAEAARVLTHPRCTNCHVAGESPLQGTQAELHEPPLVRGQEDEGVVGMYCGSCHASSNAALSRVPGAPGWKLPPVSMAWQARSAAQICAQVKDPARNGDKTLEQVVEHSAHDGLVAWGWRPGADRSTPPGTQQEFAQLMQGWVMTGAHCPEEGVR